MAERYEVFTLGKHFLHVHTEKGFTMYANAKVVNGQLTSYTDKMTRRGGSWVIDAWRFLNKKDFPINPIYTAVFGFDTEDSAVQVNATDIDVESISGVNGQLVDIGNISLAPNQSLAVNDFGGREVENIYVEYDRLFNPSNIPREFNGSYVCKLEALFRYSPVGQNTPVYGINGFDYKLGYNGINAQGYENPVVREICQMSIYKDDEDFWQLLILTEYAGGKVNTSSHGVRVPCNYLYGKGVLVLPTTRKVTRLIF